MQAIQKRIQEDLINFTAFEVEYILFKKELLKMLSKYYCNFNVCVLYGIRVTRSSHIESSSSFSFEPVLYSALCLSYHSNKEAVLFACLLSGWAATTGRLLSLKVRNSSKCLSKDTANALPHRKSNQSITTLRYSPALYQL